MRQPPFVEHQGYPSDPEQAARRAGLQQALDAGIWRTDPPPRTITPGGVRALAFDPPDNPRGTMIHFHGGGYRIGCPEMLSPYAAMLAAETGLCIVCPAYRLAPEYPFPAALNDAWRIWAALRGETAGPIIVAGDSAGGGLAASLTALAVEAGSPPAALVLLSAWLDLGVTSRCYDDNAGSDALFSRGSATEAASLYLQGADARNADASPLHADLAGFPPTLVSVGSGEVLADDSRRFHQALRAAGAVSRLVEIPSMEHVAVTRDRDLHGAAETAEAIVSFIAAVLGGWGLEMATDRAAQT